MALVFAAPRESSLSAREVATIHMDVARQRWGSSCRKCSLGQNSKLPVFWGVGNPAAPIMVVDMNTSYSEAEKGMKYAANQFGDDLPRMVFAVWAALGLKPQEDIYALNVMKCPRSYGADPDNPGKKKPVDAGPEAVEECMKAFRRQFEIVKPAVLIVQGKDANAAVLGDTRTTPSYLGHVRRYGRTCVAVSTHSPAGLTHGERVHLRGEFFEHWRAAMIRLNTLGRMWRPEAEIFARGWAISEETA